MFWNETKKQVFARLTKYRRFVTVTNSIFNRYLTIKKIEFRNGVVHYELESISEREKLVECAFFF